MSGTGLPPWNFHLQRVPPADLSPPLIEVRGAGKIASSSDRCDSFKAASVVPRAPPSPLPSLPRPTLRYPTPLFTSQLLLQIAAGSAMLIPCFVAERRGSRSKSAASAPLVSHAAKASRQCLFFTNQQLDSSKKKKKKNKKNKLMTKQRISQSLTLNGWTNKCCHLMCKIGALLR